MALLLILTKKKGKKETRLDLGAIVWRRQNQLQLDPTKMQKLWLFFGRQRVPTSGALIRIEIGIGNTNFSFSLSLSRMLQMLMNDNVMKTL